MRRIGLLVLGLLLLPASAMACGGFFCSSINLEPVQQNAERILFEMHGDGTVTATVEIRYQGSADDFSWVVPVPTELGPDDLDVAAPANALILLDDATAPTVIPPPTDCNTQGGIAPTVARASGGGDAAEFSDDDDSGVEVVDLPSVGPFQPQLLSATDADALVEWLNDNDYLITPEMEPLVAEYVTDGMFFLAMKLTEAADVSDIAPISFTYEADQPMVPIQLTGVAAEPEMGVLTFVAADTRFESANFENLAIDIDDVMVHPTTGQQNYYSLLSWRMDEAGGKAMVTQFADQLSEATDTAANRWGWNDEYSEDIAWLNELNGQYSTLTRLYARMSAWEMDDDPVFAESTGGDVSSVIDLSGRDPIEVCSELGRRAKPCGDMYCGVDAACGMTEVGAGCICPAGGVARRISEPLLGGSGIRSTVVCDRLDSEMLGSVAQLAVETTDPCTNLTCGDNGTCQSLNGFPTCGCDEGYAAVDDGSFMTCEAVQATYTNDALLWVPTCESRSCDAAGRAGASSVFGLLLMLGALRRRRA